MYDQLFCITSFKIWSQYSENSFAGVPYFDIAVQPGTAFKFLCILGIKYNFPRLVAFSKL